MMFLCSSIFSAVLPSFADHTFEIRILNWWVHVAYGRYNLINIDLACVGVEWKRGGSRVKLKTGVS